MRIKTLMVFATLSTSILYAQSGADLFSKNCSSCHATVLGVSIDLQGEFKNISPAPYIDDLIKKLKTKTKSKEEFGTFIENYINNPDKRKSLYGKRAIKEFGLMPTLKGALTQEEIVVLSNYLYSDYGKEKVVVPEKVVEIIDPREELFKKNCASCHTTVTGVSIDHQGEYKYISPAPYITDLITKLKTKTKTQQEFITFIQNYINDPDKRKSLYGKRAIKEFGLMPTLKGVMTNEESAQMAEYLYERY